MSEESLREIIGIAKNSKWSQIRKFIKFIVRNTLKRNAGYNLTALDVLVNGKKELKYDQIIKKKEEVSEIDKIKDFNHLSLYQRTQTVNNHINVSKSDGTIIVLAKIFGPDPSNHQFFDFSVNLDALEDPFFTIGNGQKINCSEILEFIQKNPKSPSLKEKKIPEKKSKKDTEPSIVDIEAFIFEELTSKNAVWNGNETKIFQRWKAKTKNKYRIETGKISHYNGKPTKLYSLYLNSLRKKRKIEDNKPKEKKNKNSLNKVTNKEKITEKYIFEQVAGKNAVWNGSETQNFLNWKRKIHKKYKKDTRKNPYYKQQPTNKFKEFLLAILKVNKK